VRIRLSDFRALVPSWLFFDDATEGLEIELRVAEEIDKPGPWETAFPRIDRNLADLFHSPEANLQLYRVSCFESLLVQSQEHLHDPASLASSEIYQLCLQLVRAQRPNARFLQLRIGEALISSFHETPV
jgi:hypothetical protein